MQNEIDQKTEWQSPEVVDLDVKDSESGPIPAGVEAHSISGASYYNDSGM